MGELFAERHGRHALLLDILARASQSLQIIVFTCDAGAWHGLPDDTMRISLEEARASFSRSMAAPDRSRS